MPVIMMSGKAQLTDAVRAVKLGAFQFLEKPLTPESVLVTVRGRAGAQPHPGREPRAARGARPRARRWSARARPWQQVRALIARVAPTEARVLLTGESGTGKELAAAAVHGASRRIGRAFVTVNCAAIPRDLVESEMFGHERGAFTGATERRLGRFELAHAGTLFLDEVGDLSAEAQAKLLRTLETGELQRLGAETLAAGRRAHRGRDQPAAGGRGGRRRLPGGPVLPAQRLPDPPARRSASGWRTCRRWWPTWPSGSGRARRRRSRPQALEALAGYAWPGNVRELANLVERLSILSGPTVDARRGARQVLRGGAPATARAPTALGRPLTEALDDFERGLIARRAHAGAGQRRRGGAAAADRPRQPVPPDAAARTRPGVVRPRHHFTSSSACDSSSAACCSCSPCRRASGRRTASSSSIPTCRPATRPSCAPARRPTSWPSCCLLQRLRHDPDAGRRDLPGRQRVRRPAGDLPRLAPSRGPGPGRRRRHQRHAVPAAGRGRGGRRPGRGRPADPKSRQPGTRAASGCCGTRRQCMRDARGHAGAARAAPSARRAGHGAHQLPDRPGPDRRCCSPPAAPTTGSKGCRSCSARRSSSGLPGGRSPGSTCAASSAPRARAPG